MDVTVAVATFGNRSWMDLADERAIPSVERLGVPWVYEHGDELHEARNAALAKVCTEWVCFLDADDELEPGFFDAMDTVDAHLRGPSVRYVTPGGRTSPVMPRVPGHHPHDCTADCLIEGNWLVIGTVAPTELLEKVGGFRDFPLYEDWDLWLRCYFTGATVAAVPQAVYRAHVRAGSRNRAPSRHDRLAAHRAIAQANGIPA